MKQIEKIALFAEILEETGWRQITGNLWDGEGGVCAFGAYGEALCEREIDNWTKADKAKIKSLEEKEGNGIKMIVDWINDGAEKPWLGDIAVERSPTLLESVRLRHRADYDDDEDGEEVFHRDHVMDENVEIVEMNDEYELGFKMIATCIREHFDIPEPDPVESLVEPKLKSAFDIALDIARGR